MLSEAKVHGRAHVVIKRWWTIARLASFVAVLFSVFHVLQGLGSFFSTSVTRSVHLGFVLTLVFLCIPGVTEGRAGPHGYRFWRALDCLLALLSALASWRVSHFNYRSADVFLHELGKLDFLAGIVLLALLLEAGRRTGGWLLISIASVFLLYTFFGPSLFGVSGGRDFSLPQVIRLQVFSSSGIYGASVTIVANIMFSFVLFGALLEQTGAAEFFVNLALAISSKSRGGAAKAAVLASAGMGSISGSAAANVLITGAVTVPLMKEVGYSPAQAAGIEAASSTGGQLMPPVMGAGAFVMAQFTGFPYSTILLASLVPALLYFCSVAFYTHFMACRLGIKRNSAVSRCHVWRKGWQHVFCLVLITVLLLLGYSPTLVALASCAAIFIVAQLHAHRLGVMSWLMAMKNAGLSILPITTACAIAGVVVGAIEQTGLKTQLISGLSDLSGGGLFGAFLWVAVVAVILGMGLPVTTSYVVLSVVAVPLFVQFGVDVLAAHLVVFWFSQTSNVTPPIAQAACAGARLSGCSPMRAGWQAFKLGSGLLLIPLMMLYAPLVYQPGEPVFPLVLAGLQTLIFLLCIAAAAEGFVLTELSLPSRLLLLLLALLFLPKLWGWWSFVVLALVLVWQIAKLWRRTS